MTNITEIFKEEQALRKIPPTNQKEDDLIETYEDSGHDGCEHAEPPLEKTSLITPNAFKLKLARGVKLTPNIKTFLKRDCCSHYSKTDWAWICPLSCRETILNTLSDREITVDSVIEFFDYNFLKGIDSAALSEKIYEEEQAYHTQSLQLFAEIREYDSMLSDSDFDTPPLESGKSTYQLNRERDFHHRRKELLEKKSVIENLKISLRNLEEEKEKSSLITPRPQHIEGISENGLPIVSVVAGEMHMAADCAEKLLSNYKMGVFQRGGKLVRIVAEVSKPKKIKLHGKDNQPFVKRSPDALLITEIDPIYLGELLGRSANWVKFDAHQGRWKKSDCPEQIPKRLIARGEWNLPVLTGIIQAPTLREDGSILSEPGYDEISGLFLHVGDITFPTIPKSPSRDDALEALEAILQIIKDFPFVDKASKSVAVSATLTALIRKSLRSAPMHAFSAPKMASGKSLLADLVGLVATGHTNSVVAQAADETEEKKRILSVLSEGDPIICYDNIERAFGSSALCSVLTQEFYKDRLLGQNRSLSVPTNATFLATGNNLRFEGDISTRALLCSLDPQCERPEEREFDIDLRKYVLENRPQLVQAGLTILRAYHVAGRPKQDIRPFGRFEDWSNWIRSSLVWVGMEDPCTTRLEIEALDPVRAELGALLSIWFDIFHDLAIKVDSLIKKATPNTENGTLLQDILLSISPKGLSARSIGKYLSSKRNRIEQGFRLELAGEERRALLWRVKKV